MINHISLGVHNPEKVAGILAELWNGYVLPFPACPGSFIVFADDERGTVLEITPNNVVLVPGEGLPGEDNFASSTPTEEHEAKFIASDFSPKFVATHLNLNTQLSEVEIKALAAREGWRCFKANRAGGLFQLMEFWVENRFLLEVNTPEMTANYVRVTKAQNFADFLHIPLPPPAGIPNNVSLIG